jgi:hypothetical protein
MEQTALARFRHMPVQPKLGSGIPEGVDGVNFRLRRRSARERTWNIKLFAGQPAGSAIICLCRRVPTPCYRACAPITPEVPTCGGRPLFEDTTTRTRGPRFPGSNSRGQTIFSFETAERHAGRALPETTPQRKARAATKHKTKTYTRARNERVRQRHSKSAVRRAKTSRRRQSDFATAPGRPPQSVCVAPSGI